MTEFVITNARIVTRNDVVTGTVAIRDGRFAAIGEGTTQLAAAIDFEGDYFLPGLVELHTDNLDRHFAPRPGIDWPAMAAMTAHDNEIAAAGITTVFDAVFVGDSQSNSVRFKRMKEMTDVVKTTAGQNTLRSEHYLHIRCEVSSENLMEQFMPLVDEPLVRLVSVMDHTPGQRQFVDTARHRRFHQERSGLSDEEMNAYLVRKRRAQETFSVRHRAMIVDALRGKAMALASHDDATENHVEEAVRDGVRIAEFPTTLVAGMAARRRGLTILMGAPNLLLGGSHFRNVSAASLARYGLLDVLSSDYVPSSLLQGIFLLVNDLRVMALPEAVAIATANPANAVNLDDRGEVAVGKRADFIRCRETGDIVVLRETWREGRRVA